MREDQRPEDNGEENVSSFWRSLLTYLGVIAAMRMLASLPLPRARRLENGERGQEIGEETGLLSSPWFWRGLWILIASLMVLLFIYEFTVLSH
jgi:hypothetical protein